MARKFKMFISYSHLDEHSLMRLSKHLSVLKREGSVSDWFDQKIPPGGNIDQSISAHLDECDIFVALVSVDFLASNYCYDKEMQRALKRHEEGTLRIVPVIVQPCDWQGSPLGKLKALPKDGKPTSDWTNENNAWLDVVTQIRLLVRDMEQQTHDSGITASVAIARTGKYRVKRDFDDVDKLDYCEKAFSEMRDYFEKACGEIREVEYIKSKFGRLGENGFTCTVVNRAKDRSVAHITVYSKSGRQSFGDITYSFTERAEPNTANGWFQVEADQYELSLRQQGMYHGERPKLQPLQAAEQLWNEFLEKAGISYG